MIGLRGKGFQLEYRKGFGLLPKTKLMMEVVFLGYEQRPEKNILIFGSCGGIHDG